MRRSRAAFELSTIPNSLDYRWMAAALGQLGRTEEARAALEKSIAFSHGSSMSMSSTAPWMRPEDYEHMLDGLRKAGWQGEPAITRPPAFLWPWSNEGWWR